MPSPETPVEPETAAASRFGGRWLLVLGLCAVVLLAAAIGYQAGRGSGDGDAAPSTTAPAATSSTTEAGPAATPEGRADCDGRTLDADLVPSCGALLGTTNRMVDDLDLATQEALLDRPFDMVRIYKVGPDARFFDGDELALADQGRVLVYSWKVINEPGAWARVAAGEFDDQLLRVAAEIVASGHTAMFSLHHEPEDNVPTFGTNADYVSMMRHAHSVMEPVAGDQLVWFINYRGHSFGSYDQVEAMYPGDDVLDWISWNPYNWFGCQGDAPWTSFADQARPFYEWAQANHPDKPLMIGETATNEDPAAPTRKAEWIAEMGNALETDYPEVKAVLWFQQSTASNFCERRWDSSDASIAAFSTLATDPYFADVIG